MRLRSAVTNRWVARGALVLAVVALVFVGTNVIRGDKAPNAPAASRDLARRFAVAVTSFDHRKLDADVARVLALGTEGFEREFRDAMGADFTDRIAANKTISVGEIVAGPTVQRRAAGRSTFLVVLDQQVTSEGAGGTPQLVRVGLLVTVQDDLVKVAAVQVL